MSQASWWELPLYPFRPQYLQLALLLQERQPSPADRRLDLAVAQGGV